MRRLGSLSNCVRTHDSDGLCNKILNGTAVPTITTTTTIRTAKKIVIFDAPWARFQMTWLNEFWFESRPECWFDCSFEFPTFWRAFFFAARSPYSPRLECDIVDTSCAFAYLKPIYLCSVIG